MADPRFQFTAHVALSLSPAELATFFTNAIMLIPTDALGSLDLTLTGPTGVTTQIMTADPNNSHQSAAETIQRQFDHAVPAMVADAGTQSTAA